jgi:hypothetical protein
LIWLVRRWQPQREIVLIGDGGFASARLSHTCRRMPRLLCVAPPLERPTL